MKKLNCGIENSSLCNQTNKGKCIKYVLSHIINYQHNTVTLLQLAQKGRRVNVLENYLIQLFQHSNIMINSNIMIKYKY